MANENIKEIKTRIALKTLDIAGWEAIKETYKPLKGEVCICEVPTGNNVPTANSVAPPTVLFKVGDGVNFWKDLNWASALAADVYTWAKKSESEFIEWVNDNIVHPTCPPISLTHEQGQEAFTDDEIWVVSGLEVVGENGHTLMMTNELAATKKGIQSAIGEYEKFDVDNTTVNALGGIPAGTNLKGQTLHQILEALLLPYVAPVLSGASRTVTNQKSVYEKGETNTITGASIKVEKKSKAIKKVELYQGTTLLDTKDNLNQTSGTTTYSFTGLNVDVPASTSVTLTFKVYDEDALEDSKKIKTANTPGFSYYYPYYYGVCAPSAELNEALIEGLTKDISAKANKTYTYTTDAQRMVIAYPTDHKQLSIVKDSNGLDNSNAFGLSNPAGPTIVPITGLDGTTKNYYVYANGVTSCTATMTFTHKT